MNARLSSVCVCLLATAAAGAQVVHAPAYPFFGGAAGDYLGWAVSGAGDVNGDGFDDVIVGAGYEDTVNGNGSGSARVLSGLTGTVLYTIDGHMPGVLSGRAVGGAGDVNNDGFDDVIIGADSDDTNGMNAGSARVYSGATGLVLHTFNGDAADERLGASVSGAGDVNGDGFDDVIVGAFLEDANGSNSGSAFVFSGVNGALLHRFNGDAVSDWLGSSVGGAGDVNGDGFDDLIVGIELDDNNGTNAGAARVFCGATGAILHHFDGDSAGDLFGGDVSGAGDVNGDGFDDVIVGARADDNNGDGSGSSRVFSGATGAILHHFDGDSAGDFFGGAVSGAGDVNGDGFDDLIVGASSAENNGVESGMARVFCGATGAILATFHANPIEDSFGFSVSGAGDLNGDGIDDLIVGGPGGEFNGSNSGSARVFLSLRLPKPCPGDLDGDGDADFADLNTVISNFNTSCAP